MSQYGSNVATFKVGANFVTAFITGSIDVEKVAEIQEETPLGATVTKQLFTGLTTLSEFSIDGPYDDTATTGPDAIFGGGLGTTAVVIILYGAAKSTTVTLGIKAYKRTIEAGKVTRYVATFAQMGTSIVEA